MNASFGILKAAEASSKSLKRKILPRKNTNITGQAISGLKTICGWWANIFGRPRTERVADVHYDEHRDIISVEMGYFDTEQREDLRYTDYYIKNEFGFYVKKEW